MAKETTKPEQQIDYEKIAAKIREIGELGKRIEKSGLSRRAAVLLLHDMTGVGKPDCRAILDALPNLPKFFLAQVPKIP